MRSATVYNIKAIIKLTCGFTALGIAQVTQGTLVVSKMVEGNSSTVHGLKVILLVSEDLQTVFLNPLIIHQLRLQQACYKEGESVNEKERN